MTKPQYLINMEDTENFALATGPWHTCNVHLFDLMLYAIRGVTYALDFEYDLREISPATYSCDNVMSAYNFVTSSVAVLQRDMTVRWPIPHLRGCPLDLLAVSQDALARTFNPEALRTMNERIGKELIAAEKMAAVVHRRTEMEPRVFVGMAVRVKRVTGIICSWFFDMEDQLRGLYSPDSFTYPLFGVLFSTGELYYMSGMPVHPIVPTREVVRPFFEGCTIFSRYFTGVDINSAGTKGRLIFSQEVRTAFPDDDAVGAAWVNSEDDPPEEVQEEEEQEEERTTEADWLSVPCLHDWRSDAKDPSFLSILPFSMNSGSVDCGQGNPDISGIGVRLSFYLQNFLLVLLVDRSWEDAPSALWTFTSTSFGLTIAAIVQAQQAQLSFFQALQVTNLVWLANFGSFLALASYSRHRTIKDEEQKTSSGDSSPTCETDGHHHRRPGSEKSRPDLVVKLAAMSQIFFSMALTLVTWARPDIFSNDGGDSKETCDVKYVAFFGAIFPARGSGRVLGLTATCLLFIGYLVITMHELHVLVTKNRKRDMRRAEKMKREEERDLNLPTLRMPMPEPSNNGSNDDHDLTRSPSPYPPSGSPMVPPEERERKHRHRRLEEHRSRRANWGTDLDPMLLGLTIFQVIVFTYFIVCEELLLHINTLSDNSDQQWGFGQILALIVVVPSLISVIGAFREHKFGNLHHTKSKSAPRDRGIKEKKRRLSV
ncbi:hypothetical protein EUX98_g747 [Antrodiella citrinella]|uniref:Uncharacterized protein n=1 Tax=Antrodiella citrinella TaxID=2447956 RepID=A0A4S4N6B7_9APHY|nr:hypothetical protein EUX98_g747 [Antrodiella citrinella]